eukprot:2495523-Amphidinium_carterae.1
MSGPQQRAWRATFVAKECWWGCLLSQTSDNHWCKLRPDIRSFDMTLTQSTKVPYTVTPRNWTFAGLRLVPDFAHCCIYRVGVVVLLTNEQTHTHISKSCYAATLPNILIHKVIWLRGESLTTGSANDSEVAAC